MINSDKPVYGVVVNLGFLAVLEVKLHYLDLLRALFNGAVKNHNLKIIEFLAFFRRKPSQAGKTAVAVDYPPVHQDNSRLPLINQFYIVLRFFDSVWVALDYILLDD